VGFYSGAASAASCFKIAFRIPRDQCADSLQDRVLISRFQVSVRNLETGRAGKLNGDDFAFWPQCSAQFSYVVTIQLWDRRTDQKNMVGRVLNDVASTLERGGRHDNVSEALQGLHSQV
jgi:hypothetical protein